MSIFKIERVTVDSPDSLKDRVYRLRYEIYREEMKLPIAAESGRIFDHYDEFSTNFLISCDEKDIGTVRWTPAGHGPLEIELQCPAWRHIIEADSEQAYRNSGEINRFMIKKEFRASSAALSLLNAMRKNLLNTGFHLGYFAGKHGPLTRYYLRYGTSVIDHELRPYVIDGKELGQYCLMKIDIGRPNSLRQRVTSLNFLLLETLNSRYYPLYKAIMNRGEGFRTSAS